MNDRKEEIIKFDSITKSFSGVIVLDHVTFGIQKGEVHGILGENGAGKSTLIKILSGVYTKDFGSIFFDSREVRINSPKEARDLGIATIYQEMSLVPTLNAVDNLFLGNEICFKSGLINYGIMEERAKQVLKNIGVKINLQIPIEHLSTAEQQIIEITKALLFQNQVIVMDEPTSSLSAKDIAELFRIIKQLREEGTTIIFISHKLEELEEIGDRVTILRDGKYINTVKVQNVSVDEIITMIVGREFDANLRPVKRPKRNQVVLKVKNLTTEDRKARNISFVLEKGKILGFAGLIGAGRTALMKAIFGRNRIASGEMHINGQKINKMNTGKAVKLGIAYLTEDRKNEGLVLGMAISKNITLVNLDKIKSGILLDLQQEIRDSELKVTELDIVTSSINKEVRYLSGGNQQKVVVAKWLYADSDIILFDEPTRGIDVGARLEIYNIMNHLVDNGKSIIMVSSDLPEILSMSNSIIVMREGSIVGNFDNNETITQETIMKPMLGAQ
jgi:ribose transport system ATP-binding protein